jgi:DNA helicase-2/ATP-dependent DNA helicase PcrA
MSKVIKVLGPPGTGKTTTLLNYVQTEMESVPIEKIGYFSFTRKAANEARDRAIEKFGLDKKRFKWFSTLHSCGYHSINQEGRTVMGKPQFKSFADKIGLKAKLVIDTETGMSDNVYLNQHNLARARGIPLEEHYRKYVDTTVVEWKYLEHLSTAYDQFKEDNRYIDYADMIYEAVNENLLPTLEVVFIDEAQDLTPMQWAMVEHFASTSERLYLAGDDDQAIYRWLGADVERFIDYPAEEIVLPKSYRVKKEVQAFAQQIIGVTKNRIEKKWEPQEEEGKVNYHQTIESVDLSKGEWLLLGRDKFILNKLEEECRNQGLWYEKQEHKNIIKPIPQRMFDAVIGWNDLVNGEMIDKKTIKKVFFYKKVSDKYEEELEKMNDTHLYDLDTLKVLFGPFSVGEWQYALEKINIQDRAYLMRLGLGDEDITKDPRIKISTIHAAKGGECDNVLLTTDMNIKTYTSYQKDSDDEQRVFYVGATRAKEELHVLLPQTTMHFRLAL